MTTNLRISLTVLSIGFAIEGGGEAYSLLTRGSLLPGTSLLFVIPTVITFLGLLFLLIGRHEWNELHRQRVRRANLIFVLSLLGGFIGAGEVGVLVAYPSIGEPTWALVLFGASVGSLVFGTFLTYGQLVFHLVRRPSQIALAASVVWAFIVSAYIGQSVARDLPAIVALAASRNLGFTDLVAPIDYLASFLFISYFLLLAAYVDAHFAVARGPPARAGAAAVGPTNEVRP
ncbi:MAG TPA: hypothetical protein VEL82_00665 [Thermoplasmata archaeon]|nr:hypothetical protein [Thermoplasmata archaeon]